MELILENAMVKMPMSYLGGPELSCSSVEVLSLSFLLALEIRL